jgi:hypothetical protein
VYFFYLLYRYRQIHIYKHRYMYYVFPLKQMQISFSRKRATQLKATISQKVFHFGSNLQKRCQIKTLSTLHLKKKIYDFFWDSSQIKKNSEIKLSLVYGLYTMLRLVYICRYIHMLAHADNRVNQTCLHIFF